MDVKMLKKQNVEKIEQFIAEFYKDLSKCNMNKWSYDDGCIMLAAIQLYEVTGKTHFRDFVVEYMNQYISQEGQIKSYRQEHFKLDDVAAGRAVLFAYEQTGQEKYRKAVDLLLQQLADQPRISEGNFWHKQIYPNQVWLDGLFMALPFYMACDTKLGKNEHYVDICNQFQLVMNKMYNEEKGLLYHGYDASKSIFWADNETGLSENFWLRAIGWYLIACVDTAEEMDKKQYDDYRLMGDIYKRSIRGVLKYRDDETGLFYQVVDGKDIEGNYLETSGSAMIAASILKGCRLRLILTEKYQEIGEGILEDIIEQRLVEVDGELKLQGNCSVAGLGPDEQSGRDGTVAYYLSEKVIDNDKKGIGALFMAYAQYLKLNKELQLDS